MTPAEKAERLATMQVNMRRQMKITLALIELSFKLETASDFDCADEAIKLAEESYLAYRLAVDLLRKERKSND